MPLNKLTQIYDTTAIKSIPNQSNNLLDFIGTSGNTVASITSGGLLDLRASSGNPITANVNDASIVGDKIRLWGGEYGIGIQGSRIVSYLPSNAAFAIRNSLTGSDIIKLNGDGNTSTRYLDSINNTGPYFDMGIGAGPISILNRNTTHTQLLIRAMTSQTGNLQEWQNSASSIITKIDASGVLGITKASFTGGTSTISALTLADGTISFESTAGQLFSISNSLTGTIFSINDVSGLPSVEVTDVGIVKLNELYGQTVVGSGTPATSAQLSAIARTSATIPLAVRGASGQSVNLQEWQNSTTTTVASISNTGAITAVDLTLSGNLTVNGTTTNINTVNLVVEDKNIILGDVASPSTTTADGGGITLLAGGSNKTFNWINATDRWTSSVGLEGSSIVRTGGTASQFLKADGSVDSSTYLTTSTASSTYAPIASPVFTGSVYAPLLKVGNAPYYQYETRIGGAQDLAFKKIATLNLPTGLYTGISFYIEVIEVGGNFGNTSASTKSVYFVSAVRSGGVQDDSMSMSITGPSTNRYLQGVKVDSATYEIQAKSPSDWNHVYIKAYGISGLNSSVTWADGSVNGSTGIATYTPTAGNNHWFGNIKYWGTLSKDGGTSSQFLKADGSVDSSTYLTTGTAASTYLPLTGGTISSNLTITGDLVVNGTTTNINTTNLVVEDKNIILGDVASPSTTTADGGGITLLAGGSNKTFNWINATDRWTSGVGLEGSSIVRTGGTASQFLKADGSVDSSTYITGNQSITLSGDVTGSGTTAITTTLANSGATAGTYKSVTVDVKGRVTGGTNPTTLSGYGITDALSNSTTSTQSGYFGDIFLFDDSTPSHYLQITNSANLTAARILNINTNDADRTISISGNLTVSSAATISGTNTGDQTITLTGDVTGSGTGSFATTLANSGATAGTYKSVTVDVKGRVTGGTNPTTLSGYGITDALDTSGTAQTKSGTLTAASFIPSGSTAPTNGMYLPAANTVGFSSNSTQRLGIDANGTIKFLSQVAEAATVSATAAATTVTYDVMTNKNVLYYTSNATADWTFNVRGSATVTLNTLMDIGQSLTVVFMNTNGATAYRATAFQIDGTAVTPKWFGGSAPTAGNASSIDVYTYNIIKTAASTYTVLASLNKFA